MVLGLTGSWGRSVSINTVLWAGWPGFNSQQGQRIFSFHYHIQTGSGVHSASYPMGNVGSFPRGKAARA